MLLQFSTVRNTIQETDMDRWISELQRTTTSKTIRSEERLSNPNDACTEVDKEKSQKLVAFLQQRHYKKRACHIEIYLNTSR